MKRREYRVVRDAYLGYEAQVRRWWHWPLWVQVGGANTSASLGQAIDRCRAHKAAVGVVQYLGSNP